MGSDSHQELEISDSIDNLISDCVDKANVKMADNPAY